MTDTDPRSRLKEILLSELILYTRLLSVEDQKKQAMVDLDRATLETTVKTEAEIMDKLRRLERGRIAAMDAVCERFGLDVANSGLEEIADAMDETWRKEFLDLRARLQEVGGDVHRANDLNRMLCTQSLQHIQMTLGLLAFGGGTGSGAYTPAGPQADAPVTRHLIDQRV